MFDLAIVGGGLGGAALAVVMARAGARVLVLEREARFRDRVRGEGILPWGCEEARRLGLLDALRATCGREVAGWTTHLPGGQSLHRDLPATTPSGLGMLNFHHEAMQEALITLAAEAGAEVRRAVEVTGVTPGASPSVSLNTGQGGETVAARLVVGADGRASRVRGWAGLEARRAPDFLVVASTLHAGVDCDPASIHVVPNGAQGRAMVVYPLDDGRVRTYLIHRSDEAGPRFSGSRAAPAFLAACQGIGGHAGWYDRAEQIGLLASFEGASSWVEHPYRDGVVLIGDAAGASDPAFGAGLALTLRDVRVLRDHLLADADWLRAASRYAAEQNAYFAALKRIIDWRAWMGFASGPQADADRARAQPAWRADPGRVPDVHALGPDAPSDETARRRYFAL